MWRWRLVQRRCRAAAWKRALLKTAAGVVGRRLAGDDTGQGGGQRASLRLPANRVGILRIQLYRYR